MDSAVRVGSGSHDRIDFKLWATPQWVFCWMAVLGLSVTSGCQSSTSTVPAPNAEAAIPRQDIDGATLAKLRERWLQADEPGSHETPAQVRARLSPKNTPSEPLAEGADAPVGTLQVVVSGKIGAAKHLLEPGSSYPWEPGLASFIIGDPKLSDEKHKHQSGDTACKFCARKARDGSALVRFLDGEKTLAIDSRTLFDVREGQSVIVVGTAHLNTLDQLVIDAERLFVAK
ncbi:MAG: hypothetical protein O3C60_18295 [Planctomycetota bacterium]|nr:hypothetical protein [Planctomycetota bacterium]